MQLRLSIQETHCCPFPFYTLCENDSDISPIVFDVRTPMYTPPSRWLDRAFAPGRCTGCTMPPPRYVQRGTTTLIPRALRLLRRAGALCRCPPARTPQHAPTLVCVCVCVCVTHDHTRARASCVLYIPLQNLYNPIMLNAQSTEIAF